MINTLLALQDSVRVRRLVCAALLVVFGTASAQELGPPPGAAQTEFHDAMVRAYPPGVIPDQDNMAYSIASAGPMMQDQVLYAKADFTRYALQSNLARRGSRTSYAANRAEQAALIKVANDFERILREKQGTAQGNWKFPEIVRNAADEAIGLIPAGSMQGRLLAAGGRLAVDVALDSVEREFAEWKQVDQQLIDGSSSLPRTDSAMRISSQLKSMADADPNGAGKVINALFAVSFGVKTDQSVEEITQTSKTFQEFEQETNLMQHLSRILKGEENASILLGELGTDVKDVQSVLSSMQADAQRAQLDENRRKEFARVVGNVRGKIQVEGDPPNETPG